MTIKATPVGEHRPPDDNELREMPWGSIQPTCTIRLKSGVWWVIERDGPRLTMQHARSGRTETGAPPAGRLVRVLFEDDSDYVPPPAIRAAERAVATLPAAPAAELATLLVESRLGGVVVATRDLRNPTEPTRCPGVKSSTRGILAAHLWCFHALESTDIPDLAAPPEWPVLVALHDTRRGATPHSHDL
jgi:hypothetical protein